MEALQNILNVRLVIRVLKKKIEDHTSMLSKYASQTEEQEILVSNIGGQKKKVFHSTKKIKNLKKSKKVQKIQKNLKIPKIIQKFPKKS